MSKSDLYPEIFEALGYVKTDALSNLEAKRGCQWANRIIVATIKAVEHFETIKALYIEGKQIDFHNVFSTFLQQPGGCLAVWQDACGDCIKEKTIPNKDEEEALDFAGNVLWQNFLTIFGPFPGEFSAYDCTGVAIRMQDVAEKDNETTRKALKESIQFHTLNIAETCYRLSLREWKLWYDHKDWPIDWGEWEVGGLFDGRGAVEKLYPALKAFDENHHDVFADLYIALHGLLHECDHSPRAFVSKDSPKAPLKPFDRSVVALLTLDPEITFEYPTGLATAMGYDVETHVPSRFLLKSRGYFLYLIYENVRANAKKAPSDVSRRMWLEAAAELLQNMSLRQPVYTQVAAERIIELANRAQRESWIERMMKGDRPAPAEFKRTLDAEPTKQPDHTPAAKDDLEERVERILARHGIKAKAKRKETGSSTAVELGKYAAEFVTLCDPKKGLLVLNGNVTFNIPPTSKQVWKVVKKLVQSKDPDGWTKLPPKWKSSFHRKDKLGKPAADSSHEQLLKLIKPQNLHPGCKGTKHHLIPPSA